MTSLHKGDQPGLNPRAEGPPLEHGFRQAPSAILSDRELLESWLPSLGAANPPVEAAKLIDDFGSVSGVLDGSLLRLCTSVGQALAEGIHSQRVTLKAALVPPVAQRRRIAGSTALLNCLRSDAVFFDEERLLCVFADRALRLLRAVNLAEVAQSSSAVDIRYILQEGVCIGAAGFVLVQNRLFGDSGPNKLDRELTKRLQRAGDCLGMQLLDHIIVTKGSVWTYTGFAERA